VQALILKYAGLLYELCGELVGCLAGELREGSLLGIHVCGIIVLAFGTAFHASIDLRLNILALMHTNMLCRQKIDHYVYT
jgi:hypothetical protein